jgi:hypothetical protein
MCCGRNRPTLPQTRRMAPAMRMGNPVNSGGAQPATPAKPVTYFQYNGRTALTVNGPVTGVTYRFHAPGRRVVVDLRDRQSLVAIPQLTEVRSL